MLDVRLVSCADNDTDLHADGLAVYDRFKGGRDGTFWYYRTLSDVVTRLMP